MTLKSEKQYLNAFIKRPWVLLNLCYLANLAQRRFITVIVAGKHLDDIPLSSLSLSSTHINRSHT